MTRWYAPAYEGRDGEMVVVDSDMTRHEDFCREAVDLLNEFTPTADGVTYFVAVMDKPEWKRL